MRTITLDVIRERGDAPRFGVKLEDHPRYVTFLAPDEVGTWLQGFLAALSPLPDSPSDK